MSAEEGSGALGRPMDELVGTVTSVPPQPLGVICNDPRSPMRGMVYYYNNFDLMLAITPKATHSQLSVGDRVELSNNYIKTKGDHWCLDDGKKKSKGAVKGEMRVGVVIFAPPLLRSKPRAVDMTKWISQFNSHATKAAGVQCLISSTFFPSNSKRNFPFHLIPKRFLIAEKLSCCLLNLPP
jgi:hypothetical protein